MKQLKNIIKYDLVALKRPLLTLGIIDLAVYLLWLLIAKISGIVSALALTTTILSVMAIVGLLVALWIFQLIHYYRSMYGDGGYFTMALPVKSSTLVNAKILFNSGLTFVALLITFLQILLGVTLLAPGIWSDEALAEADLSLAKILLFWTLFLLFQGISSAITLVGFVTIGNRPFWLKMGKYAGMILFYLAFSTAASIVYGLLFLLPGAIQFDIVSGHFGLTFDSTIGLMMQESDQEMVVPLSIIGASLIELIGFWWYSIRSVRYATSLR